mgnify:CR=1 FL=1
MKIYIDFEVRTVIRQEDLQSKHTKFIFESETLTLPNEDELMEKPRHPYECLNMNKRRFRNEQRIPIEEPNEPLIRVPYTFRNSLLGQSKTIFSINRLRNHDHSESVNVQGFLRLEIIDSGCGIQKKTLIPYLKIQPS